MTTRIDVWIAKPGNACTMDDRAWLVTVRDAHGNSFSWAGASYADRKAPKGHWASTIPPGTYVVSAAGQGHGGQTDRAIVAIDPGESASVVLYVAPPLPPLRLRPQSCAVRIASVVGGGGGQPDLVRVAGTASGCKSVKVAMSCGSDEPAKAEAEVAADGAWSVLFRGTANQGCRCGGPITVVARCASDPSCVDRYEGKLECDTQQPPAPRREVLR